MIGGTADTARPVQLREPRWNLFRISPVDVDDLIESANEARNAFGWGGWAPDPDDTVLDRLVRPPLTASIVREYGNYRAWLEVRAPTQDYRGAIESELRGVWMAARMNMDFRWVALVVRDLHVWSAVQTMPRRERGAVRPELLRRFEPASTLITGRRRVSDAQEDWMHEHGPGTAQRRNSYQVTTWGSSRAR